MLSLVSSFVNFGRNAPRIPMPEPELTTEEQRRLVEQHLHEARVRLERLKTEVDVTGRRDD